AQTISRRRARLDTVTSTIHSRCARRLQSPPKRTPSARSNKSCRKSSSAARAIARESAPHPRDSIRAESHSRPDRRWQFENEKPFHPTRWPATAAQVQELLAQQKKGAVLLLAASPFPNRGWQSRAAHSFLSRIAAQSRARRHPRRGPAHEDRAGRRQNLRESRAQIPFHPC